MQVRSRKRSNPQVVAVQDLQTRVLSLRDVPKEYHSMELDWFEHDLIIQKPSERSVKGFLIGVLGLLIGLGAFFFFHFQILALQGISETLFHILFAMNLLLLLKCVQCVYYRKDLFASGGVVLKGLFRYFIPIFIFIGFFSYLLFLNWPFDLVANLNYAASEDLARVLPILLYILFGTSLIKMGLDRLKGDLDGAIEALKNRRYEDEYARLRHRVFNHFKFSFLWLFLVSTILIYFELDVATLVLVNVADLLVTNLLYAWKANVLMDRKVSKEGRDPFVSRMKQKWSTREKKKHRFVVSPWILLLIGGIAFGVLTYLFDWWGLQSSLVRLVESITGNAFLLTLLIINGVFLLLFPLLKIIIYTILCISRVIYRKGLQKYFNGIFVSLVLFFFLKIMVFNIELLQLPEIYEWAIVVGITLLMLYLSMKLKLVKGVVT